MRKDSEKYESEEEFENEENEEISLNKSNNNHYETHKEAMKRFKNIKDLEEELQNIKEEIKAKNKDEFYFGYYSDKKGKGIGNKEIIIKNLKKSKIFIDIEIRRIEKKLKNLNKFTKNTKIVFTNKASNSSIKDLSDYDLSTKDSSIKDLSDYDSSDDDNYTCSEFDEEIKESFEKKGGSPEDLIKYNEYTNYLRQLVGKKIQIIKSLSNL